MSSLRIVIYVLGGAAALALALLIVPAFGISGDLRTYLTWLFWVAFIALLVALYVDSRREPEADAVQIEGPAFARFLFNNRAAGLFWLPIRVFVGVSFLDAGIHKVTDPAWTNGGSALLTYWQRAAVIPEAPARPAITYDWYRDFITFLINGHHESWFAWVVTLGELAIGVGLILGALTGIAAFFGAFMNMSFLLAGSASTNPVLFTFAIGLMLAWKVAGYYGVDRWLLPRLGTPWRPGVVFSRTAKRDEYSSA